MKTRRFLRTLMAVMAMMAMACGGGSSDSESDEDETGLKAAKLLIEHNSTDEDTGFQGFADGEPWNSLTLSGQSGESILTVLPQGQMIDFGLTELFFETSEPENAEVPIADVLSRLAQGDYAYASEMVEAGGSSMSTEFSHQIPAGQVLLSPSDGATALDPSSIVVSWQPVTSDLDGGEVDIVGYQVIVEEDIDAQFPNGFARALFSVHLPATVTSVAVPETFFEDNACYKYEVLAIEASGNQTLSSAAFETGTGCEDEELPDDETPMLEAAKLIIEHNATDEDTGFQGFADGDPWNELVINGPGGELVLTAYTENGLFDFGLTEFFFETSEPENAEVPINEVLARMPAGLYTFTGDMVDGDASELTATLSHTIPAGPVLLTPADGTTDVDPDSVVVSWESVTQDINGADVTIVGYQVIVESDEAPQFPNGFARPLFSIFLPATATSIAVPTEFILSGTEYQYEVLAIEQSGNQTLSSAEFTTN